MEDGMEETGDNYGTEGAASGEEEMGQDQGGGWLRNANSQLLYSSRTITQMEGSHLALR